MHSAVVACRSGCRLTAITRASGRRGGDPRPRTTIRMDGRPEAFAFRILGPAGRRTTGRRDTTTRGPLAGHQPAPPRLHRRADRRAHASASWSSTVPWARRSSATVPDEAGYRGERFADWPSDVQGNNDLLTLTQPDDHRRHPPRVPRRRRRHDRDQHLQRHLDLAVRLRHGRSSPTSSTSSRPSWPGAVCDEVAATTRAARATSPARSARPARTASISPDVNDPGARNITWDELVAAYAECDAGPARRRLRPDHHRDDLRHPQRQGRDLRRGDGLRGATAGAGR